MQDSKTASILAMSPGTGAASSHQANLNSDSLLIRCPEQLLRDGPWPVPTPGLNCRESHGEVLDDQCQKGIRDPSGISAIGDTTSLPAHSLIHP